MSEIGETEELESLEEVPMWALVYTESLNFLFNF